MARPKNAKNGSSKYDKILIRFGNKVLTGTQLMKLLNLERGTIRRRIKLGWPMSDVFTKPVSKDLTSWIKAGSISSIKIPRSELPRIQELYRSGFSQTEIAKKYQVSRRCIHMLMKKAVQKRLNLNQHEA